MSGPQTEDGYTRIANELFDAILRYPFSKRELKIVMAVVRKTYGYNKKADDMSGQQIANLTGIKRQHVCSALNELEAKKVVLKRDGVYGQLIGLNKKYQEWGGVPKQDRGVPKQDMSQIGTGGCPKLGQEGVPKQDTQKTTPKDNSKRQGYFDRFWDSYPKRVQKKTSREIWARKRLDDKVDMIVADVEKRKRHDRRWLGGYIPNPTTYLNQERWDDEVDAPEAEDLAMRGAI